MLKVTEVLSGDVFSKVQSFHSLKKNPCEFLVWCSWEVGTCLTHAV